MASYYPYANITSTNFSTGLSSRAPAPLPTTTKPASFTDANIGSSSGMIQTNTVTTTRSAARGGGIVSAETYENVLSPSPTSFLSELVSSAGAPPISPTMQLLPPHHAANASSSQSHHYYHNHGGGLRTLFNEASGSNNSSLLSTTQPATSATFLSSSKDAGNIYHQNQNQNQFLNFDNNNVATSVSGSGRTTRGSVAERVMLFEGFPQTIATLTSPSSDAVTTTTAMPSLFSPSIFSSSSVPNATNNNNLLFSPRNNIISLSSSTDATFPMPMALPPPSVSHQQQQQKLRAEQHRVIPIMLLDSTATTTTTPSSIVMNTTNTNSNSNYSNSRIPTFTNRAGPGGMESPNNFQNRYQHQHARSQSIPTTPTSFTPTSTTTTKQPSPYLASYKRQHEQLQRTGLQQILDSLDFNKLVDEAAHQHDQPPPHSPTVSGRRLPTWATPRHNQNYYTSNSILTPVTPVTPSFDTNPPMQQPNNSPSPPPPPPPRRLLSSAALANHRSLLFNEQWPPPGGNAAAAAVSAMMSNMLPFHFSTPSGMGSSSMPSLLRKPTATGVERTIPITVLSTNTAGSSPLSVPTSRSMEVMPSPSFFYADSTTTKTAPTVSVIVGGGAGAGGGLVGPATPQRTAASRNKTSPNAAALAANAMAAAVAAAAAAKQQKAAAQQASTTTAPTTTTASTTTTTAAAAAAENINNTAKTLLLLVDGPKQQQKVDDEKFVHVSAENKALRVEREATAAAAPVIVLNKKSSAFHEPQSSIKTTAAASAAVAPPTTTAVQQQHLPPHTTQKIHHHPHGQIIPRFYYPRGKPKTGIGSDGEAAEFNEYVVREKLQRYFLNNNNATTENVPTNNNNSHRRELFSLQDMAIVAKVLQLPHYWKGALFKAFGGGGSKAAEFVTEDAIISTWKRIIHQNFDDEARFLALLAKPGTHYLEPSDFVCLIQDIVDEHPGLNILKEAPEFHARYINTIISRIYYEINCSWSGRITLPELRRSKLMSVLRVLEKETDINLVTDFFSYEHFYVIYCKFWELDQDHDLVINREDLSRHHEGAMNPLIVDRIFSGAVTRGEHQKRGQMTYPEFVWFLLAEEDKRSGRSIEYWFRCMDTDGDGILTLYELEHFYTKQAERMKELGLEPLAFADIAMQMFDMLKPKHKNYLRLCDLKRCSQLTPIFFDTFINLEKYILHEHRDPFANSKHLEDPELEGLSDWCKYAAEEYEYLVSEEAAAASSSSTAATPTNFTPLSPSSATTTSETATTTGTGGDTNTKSTPAPSSETQSENEVNPSDIGSKLLLSNSTVAAAVDETLHLSGADGLAVQPTKAIQ